MTSFLDCKVILWDFDGVIMDSMPIRSNGFALVLKSFPEEQVKELMDFHNVNGGLSRYYKFRYFFEAIRNEEITEEQVQELAASFSVIMLDSLINEALLIQDSVSFIKSNWQNYEMHIVSGSDGNELRQICESLDLAKYFKSINGSPTHKNELVRALLEENDYDKSEVVLIGDSKNDFEASMVNGIRFIGYNNVDLKILTNKYITQFSEID